MTVRLLLAGLLIAANAAPAAGQVLGAASRFNLWTFGDAFMQGADAQGPVAIAGNGSFANFGVATGFTIAPPGAGLIVGGDLSYASGSVHNGSAYVGGNATTNNFSVPNGVFQTNLGAAGLPVNFAAVGAQLKANSAAWGAATATGTVANVFGTLTFIGANPGLNVFNIGGNQLTGINAMSFNVPAGATAFVNVAGASAAFSNLGVALNGMSRTKLLFNLPDATSVSMSGVSFQGSALAPYALLAHANGNIEGNVLVGQVGTLAAPATGEYHFALEGFAFDGLTPSPVPEPGAFVLAAAAFAGLALGGRGRR